VPIPDEAPSQLETDQPLLWQLRVIYRRGVRRAGVWRKNGIRIATATNRWCAAALRGESMLRATARKILLQQYLPQAAVPSASARLTLDFCRLPQELPALEHARLSAHCRMIIYFLSNEDEAPAGPAAGPR
jgi:hypothetical protein